MVQLPKHMAACIFFSLLAGGCAARHLQAKEPLKPATEPQSNAVAGAPAKELQDPGRVKLMQYSNTATAPAPTPKGEDGRLTGHDAASAAHSWTILNEEMQDLDRRIREQGQVLDESLNRMMVVIYTIIAAIFATNIFTFAIVRAIRESFKATFAYLFDFILPQSVAA